MRLVQRGLTDGLICRKCVTLRPDAMLEQVSPVFAVCSGRQVGFVPGARDGSDTPEPVLFWAEQRGALKGVPCGAVRQTLVPKRRFEQLPWSVGLNA